MKDTKYLSTIKNYAIIFVLCCHSHFSLGQETTTLKKNEDGLKRRFSVMAENKEVKHGDYSVFRYKKLIVEGQFNNNSKVGIWKYYNQEEEVEFTYDYDVEKVLTWSCNENVQNCRTVGNSAYPINSLSAIFISMGVNFEVPKGLKPGSITSRVSLAINEDGKIEDSFVSKFSGFIDFDLETIRVVKEACNEDFFPANDSFKNVKDTLTFELKYHL